MDPAPFLTGGFQSTAPAPGLVGQSAGAPLSQAPQVPSAVQGHVGAHVFPQIHPTGYNPPRPSLDNTKLQAKICMEYEQPLCEMVSRACASNPGSSLCSLRPYCPR